MNSAVKLVVVDSNDPFPYQLLEFSQREASLAFRGYSPRSRTFEKVVPGAYGVDLPSY